MMALPAAAMETAFAVAVALAVMVTVTTPPTFWIELMSVAVAVPGVPGMPVPLMGWPTTRLAMEEGEVMTLEPDVRLPVNVDARATMPVGPTVVAPVAVVLRVMVLVVPTAEIIERPAMLVPVTGWPTARLLRLERKVRTTLLFTVAPVGVA